MLSYIASAWANNSASRSSNPGSTSPPSSVPVASTSRTCAADGEDTIPRGYVASEFIQWIRNLVDRIIDFTDPKNAMEIYGFDRMAASWDPLASGEISDREVPES